MFTKKVKFLNVYSSKRNILKQHYSLNLQKPNMLFMSKNINPITHSKKNLDYLNKKSFFLKKEDLPSQNTNHLANAYTNENVSLLKNQASKIKLGSKKIKNIQQSGLQNLTFRFKGKKKVLKETLSTIKLKKIIVPKVTPLIQYVINKVKRSYLQQLKYKKSRFSKFYKGPRPRIFSKQQKRNYALVFYLGKLSNKKNRYLRFVYLKRFFRWYFLLTLPEIRRLRYVSYKRKNSLFFFVKMFESRLVNVLLRTKMVFTPQIISSLFKLGAVSVGNSIIKYPNYILKPLDIIFLNSSLIPYSFYRYFYSRFRVQRFFSDFEKFKLFSNVRDKTIMIWHWYYAYKHQTSFNRWKRYKLNTLNWNLRYVYLNTKLSCCVFLRQPTLGDFVSFFKKQPKLLYNFLLHKY